jgi:hypothetical protein
VLALVFVQHFIQQPTGGKGILCCTREHRIWRKPTLSWQLQSEGSRRAELGATISQKQQGNQLQADKLYLPNVTSALHPQNEINLLTEQTLFYLA